ncbi:MAG TPA: hypothetical protein VGB93_02490 [Methylovirgula sp.]
MNVEGIVSSDITPRVLSRMKRIGIDISKRAALKDKPSMIIDGVSYSRVYKTSIPKIPTVYPTVFSYSVEFAGDCPAIVRIEADSDDGATYFIGCGGLAGDKEVNTVKTLGNTIKVRMTLYPTF